MAAAWSLQAAAARATSQQAWRLHERRLERAEPCSIARSAAWHRQPPAEHLIAAARQPSPAHTPHVRSPRCPSTLACPSAALQDLEAQVARKKRRNVNKSATRSVAGVSMEVIQKKKAEKPEARKASREAALR